MIGMMGGGKITAHTGVSLFNQLYTVKYTQPTRDKVYLGKKSKEKGTSQVVAVPLCSSVAV
jgi:hypothetical protein